MLSAVISIHIVVCITLVIIILLQQGKGAEIGAVFGGSSTTNIGVSNQGTALSKATWVLAAAFFATSIFLAYSSTQRISGSIFSTAPARHSVMPAAAPVTKAGSHAAPPPGSAPASPKK